MEGVGSLITGIAFAAGVLALLPLAWRTYRQSRAEHEERMRLLRRRNREEDERKERGYD